MKRRLFAILSAASLLLSATVCLLWARSYFLADDFRGRWTNQFDDLSIGLLSDWGAFYISVHRVSRTSIDPDVEEGRRLSWFKSEPRGQLKDGLWFGSHRNNFTIGPTSFTTTLLALPAWAALLATATLPAAWLALILRARHRPPGLCPSCAYDLRATPYKCPECGAVPQPAP